MKDLDKAIQRLLDEDAPANCIGSGFIAGQGDLPQEKKKSLLRRGRKNVTRNSRFHNKSTR